MVTSDPVMQIAQTYAEKLRGLVAQWEHDAHKHMLMYEDVAIYEEYFQTVARGFLLNMIAEVQASAPSATLDLSEVQDGRSYS